MAELRRDLAQIVIAILILFGLILTSFWILRPFLGAAIWSTTIVVATWPLLRRLERHLWGSRKLAVLVLTLALLAILIVPLILGVGALAGNVDRIVGWERTLAAYHVPPLPGWVERFPAVGSRIREAWDPFVGTNLADLFPRVVPYLDDIARWLVGRLGSFGLAMLQFLLTIVIAAGLWSNGETLAGGLRLLAHRIAGQNGENALRLAGQAIRAVALGVVVTALVQAVLAGIGLWIAGVPYTAVLTAVMFMFCIAQLGPFLVLVPAIIWLYTTGNTGWATFLVIWSLPIGVLDNVLRPILIRRGADLPLVLVFAGVIGGLVTFGLIGLFVGPVVLVVAYALAKAWVLQVREPASQTDS